MTVPSVQPECCYMEECKEYKSPTSISLQYHGEVIHFPIQEFRLKDVSFGDVNRSLSLISLSREVLKNSRTLTAEERLGVDAFVWSHFK